MGISIVWLASAASPEIRMHLTPVLTGALALVGMVLPGKPLAPIKASVWLLPVWVSSCGNDMLVGEPPE